MPAADLAAMSKQSHQPSLLNRIARVLLCLVFIHAVIGKLTGFAGVAGAIAARGLPLAPVLLVAAMALMTTIADKPPAPATPAASSKPAATAAAPDAFLRDRVVATTAVGKREPQCQGQRGIEAQHRQRL